MLVKFELTITIEFRISAGNRRFDHLHALAFFHSNEITFLGVLIALPFFSFALEKHVFMGVRRKSRRQMKLLQVDRYLSIFLED